MIAIVQTLYYDESKSFWEQDFSVINALMPVLDTFNDSTALEFDAWRRPLRWIYEGMGIRITYTRVYQTESWDRMVSEHNYIVEQLIAS